MKRQLLMGIPAAAAVLALTACGSSGSGQQQGSSQPAAPPTNSQSAAPTSGSQQPAKTAMITIKDFKYTVPANVQPGEKITVHNSDDVAHTVTSDKKGVFDVKVDPSGNATLTAPSKSGSYSFHCTYHANMHGTLKVG